MTPTQPLTIVCLEDDLDLARLIKIALDALPVKIYVAYNGVQGLDLIRQHKPNLILLDLELPGMNGWDIYSEIRDDAALRHIPVIVITANPREHPFNIRLKQLAAYIVKPFTLSQLRSILQSSLVLNAPPSSSP